MTVLALVPAQSRVQIHTFAEGLFARLAHDLELGCADLSGSVEREGETRATARLEVPLRGIFVAGVLGKDGRVDASGLSASDKSDCLEKMRHDVFRAEFTAAVRVEATLEGARARVRVVPPNGRAVEATTVVAVRAAGDAVRASGSLELSLASLGASTVRGPMNAFRVKDRVLVLFDVVFAPA